MHRPLIHVRLPPISPCPRRSNLTPALFILLRSPGWVHTGDRSRTQEKPSGAWTADQTVSFMLDKLAQGNFYILCPDNDVSTVCPFTFSLTGGKSWLILGGQDLDKLRIGWAVGDILEDRPALSRWHPECKSFAFLRFLHRFRVLIVG